MTRIPQPTVLFALINNAARVAIEECLAGIPAIDAVFAEWQSGARDGLPVSAVNRVEQSA